MDTFLCLAPWNEQFDQQKKIATQHLTTSELWANHPGKGAGYLPRGTGRLANPECNSGTLQRRSWKRRFYCGRTRPNREESGKKSCAKRAGIKTRPSMTCERMKGQLRLRQRARCSRTVSHQCVTGKGTKCVHPYKSHDQRVLTEDIRWGYSTADMDMEPPAASKQGQREDLWRCSRTPVWVVPPSKFPTSTSRGIENLSSIADFRPEKNPQAYLDSLAIKAMSWNMTVRLNEGRCPMNANVKIRCGQRICRLKADPRHNVELAGVGYSHYGGIICAPVAAARWIFYRRVC